MLLGQERTEAEVPEVYKNQGCQGQDGMLFLVPLPVYRRYQVVRDLKLQKILLHIKDTGEGEHQPQDDATD